MEKSLTLGNEEMRTVLKEKRFQTYYEQVMHYLKEMKNRKTSEAVSYTHLDVYKRQ